jgi:hypothetical protein
MKARGLFITGLLMVGLLAALQLGYLDSFILELPETVQLMFIDLSLNTDWHFGMLVMTFVGLFSLTLKKKEEF